MTARDREPNGVLGDTGPGTTVRDLLPIPATNPNDITQQEGEHPTLSHALANGNHAEKGHAQLDHDKEVKDLGWNEPKQDIPAPLVGGMDNEELWMLVRRFDKVLPIPHLAAGRV